MGVGGTGSVIGCGLPVWGWGALWICDRLWSAGVGVEGGHWICDRVWSAGVGVGVGGTVDL